MSEIRPAVLALMRRVWSEDAPFVLPAVSRIDLGKPDVNIKTPSNIDPDGRVYRMSGWQSLTSTRMELEAWARNERLGFGVRCAGVRAIDIDIEDEATVNEIAALSNDFSIKRAGNVHKFAVRTKVGPSDLPKTARCALLYRAMIVGDTLPKQVVRLDCGNIEFLGDRQYIALYGTQYGADGKPRWAYRLTPFTFDTLPVLDNSQVFALRDTLAERFGSKVISSGFDKAADGFEDYEVTPAGEAMLNELSRHFIGEEGIKRFVTCPWAHTHTTSTGPKDAMFLPPRLGKLSGRYYGATFSCFHSHCNDKTAQDFFDEIGYDATRLSVSAVSAVAAAAAPITPAVTPEVLLAVAPTLSLSMAQDILRAFKDTAMSESFAVDRARKPTSMAYYQRPREHTGELHFANVTKAGVPASVTNLVLALQHYDALGVEVSYDSFLSALKIRNVRTGGDWQRFTDKHIAKLKILFHNIGIEDIQTGVLREALTMASEENITDCAIDWLSRVVWDGRSRLGEFVSRGLGLAETPYLLGVARYIFSGFAGRVMQPGIKADMIPIIVGRQGLRKSSLIPALSPFPEWATTSALDLSHADIARNTIGKVTLELPELKGLKTRSIETIKAWVTSQEDTWVPKYKEYSQAVKRRWIAFGTSNDMRLFNDPTGNRRWLPIDATSGKGIDDAWVADNCHQLWAEGLYLFNKNRGVCYRQAETLAVSERDAFLPKDVMYTPIKQFVDEFHRLPTVNEACSLVLGVAVGMVSPTQLDRIERTLAIIEAELRGTPLESIVQRSYVEHKPLDMGEKVIDV